MALGRIAATVTGELYDVGSDTKTNRNVLVADGTDWQSRALTEADISDLSYPSTLPGLSDVAITASAAGELLVTTAPNAWANQTTTEAGIVATADTSTSAYSWVVDEDDMVSDLPTKVPTQQSVKAYVDDAIDDGFV